MTLTLAGQLGGISLEMTAARLKPQINLGGFKSKTLKQWNY